MYSSPFPPFNVAQQAQVIYGLCFAALVPAGAMWSQFHPMGGFVILPAGSTPPPASPAVVVLEPVHPMMVQGFRQSLYSMDNPVAAMMQGMSVGLGQVSNIAPARRTLLGQNQADIRELEGVSLASGQPVRGMLILLHGSRGTAKVIVMINLFRWAEFVGPVLQFVGGINLSGLQPLQAPEVQAVVDRQRSDQIEFRVRGGPTNQWEPITALPTRVGGNVVIQIDNSFHVGNISGVGHAIGHHTTSTVGK
jgi:hypothetical protein